MAHSWVQSFDDEYTAFRKFAELYPENTILLVDTYDTLHSGLPNAIKVAEDLKGSGFKLKGIRLDSGDFTELSKKARQMLDEAGLHEVRILVSNQQDEFSVRELLSKGAPIDGFGIGTSLVVGRPDAALDGVYKLSSINGKASIKLSDNPQKTSIPGLKACGRLYDATGQMKMDLIYEADEERPDQAVFLDGSVEKINKEDRFEPLSNRVMKDGEKVNALPHPLESARYLRNRMKTLPAPFKLLSTEQQYGVALSQQLFQKRAHLIKEIKRNIHESTDHR
jgi:nicotinate phosphoribosyltransferase